MEQKQVAQHEKQTERLLSPIDSPKQLILGGVTWGPSAAVLYTLVVYFISQIIAVNLISIYPLMQHWSSDQVTNWLQDSPVAQFFLILLIESLVILLLHWFLKYRKTNFRAIGWNRRPIWTDIAYALAGFGAYFVGLNFVVFPLVKSIIPKLDFNQKQDLGFTTTHGSVLILVFISLAILPPLVEETLVRGFLYTGLRAKLPKYIAALIASIMFGAAHLELGSGHPPLWTAAIDTFFLSLILVYLRQKTDSLYASIGVHFLKNSLAFAALFIFHL